MDDTFDINDVPRNTKAVGRNWLLTINNYEPSDLMLLESIKPQLSKWGWQEEKAPTTGTIHLQVGLHFKSNKTFNSLKEMFPRANIQKAKNIHAVLNYCRKSETSTGNHKDSSEDKNNKWIVAKKDPMEGLNWHEWQIRVNELLEQEPDNRSIWWLWEPNGGTGKTTFIKHTVMKRKDVICISGSVKDIMYGITKYIDDNGRAPKIIFMNIPRSVEHISYNGLEQVKDGIFYNTKYESGMVVFDSPHVIIMANEKPVISKMSLDRWRIIRIDGKPDNYEEEEEIKKDMKNYM